jgi:hypothetical protein
MKPKQNKRKNNILIKGKIKKKLKFTKEIKTKSYNYKQKDIIKYQDNIKGQHGFSD